MISFYPGPSEVYPQIPAFVEEAYQKGILSINHRSPAFVELSKQSILTLKEKLDIPESYTVFYVSSATESWEIIAQSLILKGSFHLYNGAFGKKWYDYTRRLKGSSTTKYLEFGLNEIIEVGKLKKEIGSEGLICLTHNETSNGTFLPRSFLDKIRVNFPTKLIAIDATSSFAGLQIPFESIDICFASVQKCLGLPAGMGLLVCSPKAVAKALEIGERQHYNSLCYMIEKMEAWQTTYTPSVLSIFLLLKVVEQIPHIHKTAQRILAQASLYAKFFESIEEFDFLVSNKATRSPTVLTLEADEAFVQSIKEAAHRAGLVLGSGYGQWKDKTFRIANFPAIRAGSIKQLLDFMSRYQNKVC